MLKERNKFKIVDLRFKIEKEKIGHFEIADFRFGIWFLGFGTYEKIRRFNG
jgi:hypothetical protein